jgi:type IV secretory pathway VirB10-like protein
MKILSSEHKRRFYFISGLCLVATSALIIGVLMFFSPSSKTPESQANLAKGSGVVDRPTSAGGAGTVEYNKNLAAYDAKKAQEALAGGESYIATPIGNPKSATTVKITPIVPTDSKDDSRGAGKRTNSSPAAPPKQKSPNNDLLKRISEDLTALDNRMNGMSGGPKIEFAAKPEDRESKTLGRAKADSYPTPERAVPEAEQSPELKAGDILYAVVTTAVNSDVPAPVTATVLSGSYRKSKLLGQFQRYDERLVVAFNRLVRPDGTETGIEGYAIDPNTTEASVASRVDTHFFSRWGGLIAASFLEGLGEAKRYSGASSYVYPVGMGGGADQMAWGNYSVADQAWIAAGKVGQRSGRIMEKNFERQPTVYLHAGTQIGVLVGNTKR